MGINTSTNQEAIRAIDGIQKRAVLSIMVAWSLHDASAAVIGVRLGHVILTNSLPSHPLIQVKCQSINILFIC